MKKGDLSKFIEEAVRWRVFHRTIQDIKSHNANTDPDEIQRIIRRGCRRGPRRTSHQTEGRQVLMRVVPDTNILFSALIAPAGKPAAIYNAWVEGKFTLLTCAVHLEELHSTLLKPHVAEFVKPTRLAAW